MLYRVRYFEKSPPDFSRQANQIHACSALETERMCMLYQDYICSLVSANAITWLAFYRGSYGRKFWNTKLLDGWRLVESILPAGENSDSRTGREAFNRLTEKYDINSIAMLAQSQAGKTRVYRAVDAAGDAMMGKNLLRKEFLARHDNTGQVMLGIYHLDKQAESYLIVHRLRSNTPFSQDDEQRFYQALLEFPRLHYWLFLERGLVKPARRPFSPRQRELIKLMLTPLSEKTIAQELGLARSTTHNYIVEIFRNLGVKSRTEMIQLWLGAVP